MSFHWGKEKEVLENREHFLRDLGINIDNIVAPEIIHGAKIKTVDENDKGGGARSPKGIIKASDGLITGDSNLFLLVTVADCFPIFAYAPTIGVVANVHAGWRGIIKGIVDELLAKFQNLDAAPSDIFLGLGPGICGKHFTVKKDVLSQFKESHPQAVFPRNHNGYVDLRKAILFDLKKAKIPSQNIEVSTICPACQNGIYGSYRLEKETAPASAAVIGMKNV